MRIKKIEQNTRDFNITDAIVDGGTDLNEVTFNQMQDNIEEAIDGVVLYQNNTGTIGTVNLSQSLTNFKYIDVYGYDYASASRLHKRVESPGTGTVYFCFGDVINAEGVNTVSFKTKKYNLSENKIEINTYGGCLTVEINIMSNSISSNRNDSIHITKVVGYK